MAKQWSSAGIRTARLSIPERRPRFRIACGAVIAAGQFPRAGGVVVNYVARWNSVANAWEAFGSGLDAPAYAVTLYHGDLWVGGEFAHAGDNASSCIARWTGLPPESRQRIT